MDLGSVVDAGQVVLRWETACGAAYRVESSPGRHRLDAAAEVTAGDGGVDTGGGGQGGRQTPVERPWNGMSRPFAVKTRHQ
ncbi:hypothetical protein [Nonomuraea sp. NPDC050540]|uniref:hypothetical protein n=1 Tax=Nonomuraea sp. NPDC050540 TaxID=3364367 RepID=UPI0037B42ACD